MMFGQYHYSTDMAKFETGVCLLESLRHRRNVLTWAARLLNLFYEKRLQQSLSYQVPITIYKDGKTAT